MIRVLVADDHAVVRAGIRAVVEQHPNLAVVAEAGDADAALDAVATHRPDVVLLDLTMPGGGGLELLPKLRACSPDTRVLVLSMHDEPDYVRSALSGGAHGYVVKGAGIDDLVRAIETVARGEQFLDAHAQRAAQAEPRAQEVEDPRLAELTPREREILRCVAAGATNRVIAAQLGIALKTVDAHRTNVMRKLDAHNAPALTRLALRWGLIRP